MNKNDYLAVIAQGVSDHPEWLEDAIWALQQGMAARLKEEQGKRADAETSVALLAGNLSKVPDYQKEIVVRTIASSYMFGGTEYAKGLVLEEQKRAKKTQ